MERDLDSNPTVQDLIVKEIEDEVFLLSSRNVALSSVLIRHRSIESLFENGENLIKEIISEMSERLPFLFRIIATVATGGKELQGTKIAPVATAYAVLMNAHSDKLSAWHRMTTIVAIKGHLEDSEYLQPNLSYCYRGWHDFVDPFYQPGLSPAATEEVRINLITGLAAFNALIVSEKQKKVVDKRLAYKTSRLLVLDGGGILRMTIQEAVGGMFNRSSFLPVRTSPSQFPLLRSGPF
ncbi:hypothetical protein DPMN_165163 [Dreissena polymorpha]|uniref:Uncharacterized protein n=1 Tax=Dreissena polymorpha TaxID=45954 RepID=A0A9D4EU89_DREPO|nr:hypothetical protein DPMN_165163 [Dreissena polymorpha]